MGRFPIELAAPLGLMLIGASVRSLTIVHAGAGLAAFVIFGTIVIFLNGEGRG